MCHCAWRIHPLGVMRLHFCVQLDCLQWKASSKAFARMINKMLCVCVCDQTTILNVSLHSFVWLCHWLLWRWVTQDHLHNTCFCKTCFFFDRNRELKRHIVLQYIQNISQNLNHKWYDVKCCSDPGWQSCLENFRLSLETIYPNKHWFISQATNPWCLLFNASQSSV